MHIQKNRFLLIVSVLATVVCWMPERTRAQQTGRALFEKTWTAGEVGDHGGDGVGPLFNDRSCVACHFQGGVGGAGPIEKNMEFLAIHGSATLKQKRQLVKYHPSFLTDERQFQSAIILHRFGTDQGYAAKRFELTGTLVLENIDQMDSATLRRELEIQPVKTLLARNTIPMMRSQRNSTALFGAGLIDGISDRAILATAMHQQDQVPGISGRPSTVGVANPNTRFQFEIGRFGWRGQTSRLSDFVLDACAAELGLQLNSRSQPVNPRKPNYRPRGVDLTVAQTDALTQFVKSLPRPKQVLPQDRELAESVRRGHDVFQLVGCAFCHVQQLDNVQGIYSDLLLHDMGESLADPVPAPQNRFQNPRQFVAFLKESSVRQQRNPNEAVIPESGGASSPPAAPSSSYGGGTDLIPTASLATLQREWKTAPLWGVADSAPYLHDGRADSLIEAIAYHGGEASKSKLDYFSQPIEDRLALIDFLHSLRAAGAADPLQN